MIVKANYNMEFNNGKFKKNNIYEARVEGTKVFVKTEEGKEQDFYDIEVGMFFTFLKN